MLKLPDDHSDSRHIGTSFESITVLPNIRDGDGMVFIDLPGVLDTRVVLPRLVNMVITKQTFALPNVVIVHVIQYRNSVSHMPSSRPNGESTVRHERIRCLCDAYPSAPDVDTPYRELDGVMDWRAQLLQLLREKTPGPVVFAPREIHRERNLIVALQSTAIANATRLVQTILEAALSRADITLEQAAQVQQWLADVNTPTTFDAALALLEEIGFTQPGIEANARVLRAVQDLSSAWIEPHYATLHDAFPRKAIEPSLIARDFTENVDVVCRRSLMLPEALTHLPGESSDLKALVFIGFDSLHVDVGINQWINVVLIGKNDTVASGVAFDLSATKTLRDKPQAEKATDGVPGESGQAGGSLLVRCSTLDGSIDFKSKGQKGGNGQQGGNGIDGTTKWHTENEITEVNHTLGPLVITAKRQCWHCSGNRIRAPALYSNFQLEPVWRPFGALYMVYTVTTNDVVHAKAPRPGRGGRGGNGGLGGQSRTDVSGVMTLHANAEGTGERGGNDTAGAPSRDGCRARLTWEVEYDHFTAYSDERDFCLGWLRHWKFQGQTEIKGKHKDALEGHAGEPAASPPIAAMTSLQSIAICTQVIDRIETNHPLVRLTRQRAVLGRPHS